ncbi:hypothetical protein DC20_21245 [Rufibacter tibetensis]|uniref:Uncharacterized protein n=1 Tax=Rufibacter tibetensis TaxID=512763 RepID=A0A0P0CU37_9BACT|nr:hypothetical protein DC20_21245 [Rufibacter tibetensis]
MPLGQWQRMTEKEFKETTRARSNIVTETILKDYYLESLQDETFSKEPKALLPFRSYFDKTTPKTETHF